MSAEMQQQQQHRLHDARDVLKGQPDKLVLLNKLMAETCSLKAQIDRIQTCGGTFYVLKPKENIAEMSEVKTDEEGNFVETVVRRSDANVNDPFCKADIDVAAKEITDHITDPGEKMDVDAMFRKVVQDDSFNLMMYAMDEFDECFRKVVSSISKLRSCMRECIKADGRKADAAKAASSKKSSLLIDVADGSDGGSKKRKAQTCTSQTTIAESFQRSQKKPKKGKAGAKAPAHMYVDIEASETEDGGSDPPSHIASEEEEEEVEEGVVEGKSDAAERKSVQAPNKTVSVKKKNAGVLPKGGKAPSKPSGKAASQNKAVGSAEKKGNSAEKKKKASDVTPGAPAGTALLRIKENPVVAMNMKKHCKEAAAEVEEEMQEGAGTEAGDE